jgi:dihydroorotase
VKALLDGTIDAIATDHAPHTLDEKALAFDTAPNGVIGLETSLGVMLTHFFHTGLLTPIELIRRMSTNPARLFKLEAGELKVGALANVTVIDPNTTWHVEPNTFRSRSCNTPFKGHVLRGQASMVFAKGQLQRNS